MEFIKQSGAKLSLCLKLMYNSIYEKQISLRSEIMKNVLFITNPVAGTTKSRQAMYEVVNEFCKVGYDVTVKVTQYRGHAIELASSAKEKGFDLVVCCGGDGTLNETMTGIVRSGSQIPIGYVPAGSTNDFADNLGLNKLPALAAKAIVKEEPHLLDVGCFNEKDYFSYVASFGAFVDVSYSAPQDMKNTFGPLAYMVEALKDIGNIKPHRVRVNTDDSSFYDAFIFGAISNTKRMAGFLHIPVTDEELHDGLFEVLLVKYPRSVGEMNDIVLGVTTGEFRDNPMFTYTRSSRVELTMPKSIDWSLDGERKNGGSKITIVNKNNALTIFK